MKGGGPRGYAQLRMDYQGERASKPGSIAKSQELVLPLDIPEADGLLRAQGMCGDGILSPFQHMYITRQPLGLLHARHPVVVILASVMVAIALFVGSLWRKVRQGESVS